MDKAYKDSFGDEIGFTTNIITSQFEVQSHFSPDSPEFKELDYRIITGQLYQQNSIDKLKGIIAKPMPKYWYNKKECNAKPDDSPEERKQKEFNKRIVADKKPYFMIYIYPHLKKEYDTYIKSTDGKCLIQFGMHVEELIEKSQKYTLTEDEERFLSNYHKFMPVGMGPCVMNRICWLIESEFDDFLKNQKDDVDFDYTIMKRNIEYKQSDYYNLRKLYQQYSKRMGLLSATLKSQKPFIQDLNDLYKNRIDLFREASYSVCPDQEVLCDILLDLCYGNSKSKQFVWDMCSDTIVKRLLERNYHQITYPIRADEESKEFEYDGESFILETVKMIEDNYFKEVDCY